MITVKVLKTITLETTCFISWRRYSSCLEGDINFNPFVEDDKLQSISWKRQILEQFSIRRHRSCIVYRRRQGPLASRRRKQFYLEIFIGLLILEATDFNLWLIKFFIFLGGTGITLNLRGDRCNSYFFSWFKIFSSHILFSFYSILSSNYVPSSTNFLMTDQCIHLLKCWHLVHCSDSRMNHNLIYWALSCSLVDISSNSFSAAFHWNHVILSINYLN